MYICTYINYYASTICDWYQQPLLLLDFKKIQEIRMPLNYDMQTMAVAIVSIRVSAMLQYLNSMTI